MGKKTRVTLQDVAELAGVNPVTASVALGRSPQGGTRVSEATRLRIREAARHLNYTPNALARALQGERTHIIGCYAGYEMLDASSPFTAAILHGLQRSCRQNQQDLLLFGSFERDTVDSIFATLMSGKIDGLVVMPTPQSPVMDKLFESPLPVVAVANAHPSLPSVVVDDAAGSAMLAEHLAIKGHTRVWFRCPVGDRASVVQRTEAFARAANKLGMSLIFTVEGPKHEITPEEESVLCLPADRRPTAAVCWMDISAYVLIEFCQERSIEVPGDLAVTGFDGVPLTIPPQRVLTTIRAPWEEVAAESIEQLLALLAGKEVPDETVFPVTLQAGDTT